MKNIILLPIIFILTLVVLDSHAQCTVNTFLFPAQTVTVGCPEVTTISASQYAGDYNHTTGYVVGNTYTFISSVPTDYFTIVELVGGNPGNVITYGTTPVAYRPISTADIRCYINTNPSCGTESSSRIVTVGCGSESVCDDGLDNDGDGKIDCLDGDCVSFINCEDTSAMLEVVSTNKGFMPPRLTDTSAVDAPGEGLMIYDLEHRCMRYYNGQQWSDCMGNIASSYMPPPTPCGGFVIYNGQSYPTVAIGNQCWFAENLNVGEFIDDNIIQTDNSIIEKYCLDNDTNNCVTYGGLYQWDELMNYVTMESAQGVCPSGWHIPSDAELKTLEMELGMSPLDADYTGYRGTNEGSKMAGTYVMWEDGDLRDDAEFGNSGMNILPALSYYTGSFFTTHQSRAPQIQNHTVIWTSSGYPSEKWIRRITSGTTSVQRITREKSKAYSVRCLKD